MELTGIELPCGNCPITVQIPTRNIIGVLTRLPQAERAKAQAAQKQAAALLQRLKLRVSPPLPTCYVPPPRPLPKPKPQSRRTLDERRRIVDALEAEGKLRPAVAAMLRQAIGRRDS